MLTQIGRRFLEDRTLLKIFDLGRSMLRKLATASFMDAVLCAIWTLHHSAELHTLVSTSPSWMNALRSNIQRPGILLTIVPSFPVFGVFFFFFFIVPSFPLGKRWHHSIVPWTVLWGVSQMQRPWAQGLTVGDQNATELVKRRRKRKHAAWRKNKSSVPCACGAACSPPFP